jgi:hypothetical protein
MPEEIRATPDGESLGPCACTGSPGKCRYENGIPACEGREPMSSLADEIESEGIERVVYGKGIAEMAKINRMLVDALRTLRSESAPKYGAVADYVRKMQRSAEEGELYGFADDCRRLLNMLTAEAPRTESEARVGLPLLYNIVCLHRQPKDAQWWEDFNELMRIADKLLYEQGYEVSPYVTNEHQISADSVRSAVADNPDTATLIAAEVERARAKHPMWPIYDHLYAAAIVMEEAGELMRAAVQLKGEGGSFADCDKEAIQTAATCVRFLERK